MSNLIIPELSAREMRRQTHEGIALLQKPGLSIQDIERFQSQLIPQELPAENIFGDNVCVRVSWFKKGTMAIGAVHKRRTVSILIKGHMSVWSPFGGLEDVRGPQITVSPAGMKRMGYAHEDTMWAVAIAVPSEIEHMDGGALWDYATVQTYAEFLSFINQRERITDANTSE